MIDINALVADKIMGWHRRGDWWIDANDNRAHRIEDDDVLRGFTPTTDHNSVALVRAEIARRGMQDAFVGKLMVLRVGTGTHIFLLINASPYHQCIAALSAVGIEA